MSYGIVQQSDESSVSKRISKLSFGSRMLDNSMVLSNKRQNYLIFEEENSNFDDTAFIEEEIQKYTHMVLDNDPAMVIVEGALLSKAQLSSEEIEDIVGLIQELENNFKKVIEFSGKWPITLVLPPIY